MRSGGPGSPSASASSSRAASVLPSSASQRACSRASVSAALRVASDEQLALLPALRDAEVDRAAAALGEERLEDRGLGDGRRHVDLARDRAGAGVVLLEEAGQDLVVGRLAGRVEQEDVAPDHLAVADDEQLDGRLVVLAGQPDHVELGPGEGGHLLALHRPLDGPDLVAQDGRPLVVGPLGGAGHLAPERLDQRLLATLEEELDLLDVRAGSRPSRWP